MLFSESLFAARSLLSPLCETHTTTGMATMRVREGLGAAQCTMHALVDAPNLVDVLAHIPNGVVVLHLEQQCLLASG